MHYLPPPPPSLRHAAPHPAAAHAAFLEKGMFRRESLSGAYSFAAYQTSWYLRSILMGFLRGLIFSPFVYWCGSGDRPPACAFARAPPWRMADRRTCVPPPAIFFVFGLVFYVAGWAASCRRQARTFTFRS